MVLNTETKCQITEKVLAWAKEREMDLVISTNNTNHPELFVAVPDGVHAGLWIRIGMPEAQDKVLLDIGYAVHSAVTAEEAENEIEDYFAQARNAGGFSDLEEDPAREEALRHGTQIATIGYLSGLIDMIMHAIDDYPIESGQAQLEKKYFYKGMVAGFVSFGDGLESELLLSDSSWLDTARSTIEKYEDVIDYLTADGQPWAYLLPNRLYLKGQIKAYKHVLDAEEK